MTAFTDAERDSLTECECGHYANEHNSQGCTATVDEDAGTWQESYGDYICDCLNTPNTIRNDAIATVITAREQAATLSERERLLGSFSELAEEHWDWKAGQVLARRLRDLIAQERAQ